MKTILAILIIQLSSTAWAANRTVQQMLAICDFKSLSQIHDAKSFTRQDVVNELKLATQIAELRNRKPEDNQMMVDCINTSQYIQELLEQQDHHNTPLVTRVVLKQIPKPATDPKLIADAELSYLQAKNSGGSLRTGSAAVDLKYATKNSTSSFRGAFNYSKVDGESDTGYSVEGQTGYSLARLLGWDHVDSKSFQVFVNGKATRDFQGTESQKVRAGLTRQFAWDCWKMRAQAGPGISRVQSSDGETKATPTLYIGLKESCDFSNTNRIYGEQNFDIGSGQTYSFVLGGNTALFNAFRIGPEVSYTTYANYGPLNLPDDFQAKLVAKISLNRIAGFFLNN